MARGYCHRCTGRLPISGPPYLLLLSIMQVSTSILLISRLHYRIYWSFYSRAFTGHFIVGHLLVILYYHICWSFYSLAFTSHFIVGIYWSFYSRAFTGHFIVGIYWSFYSGAFTDHFIVGHLLVIL